jgi:hypothetical protein
MSAATPRATPPQSSPAETEDAETASVPRRGVAMGIRVVEFLGEPPVEGGTAAIRRVVFLLLPPPDDDVTTGIRAVDFCDDRVAGAGGSNGIPACPAQARQ